MLHLFIPYGEVSIEIEYYSIGLHGEIRCHFKVSIRLDNISMGLCDCILGAIYCSILQLSSGCMLNIFPNRIMHHSECVDQRYEKSAEKFDWDEKKWSDHNSTQRSAKHNRWKSFDHNRVEFKLKLFKIIILNEFYNI